MRSGIPTAMGLASTALVAIYVATSCLTPDFEDDCGPDDPCFKGEVCVDGECESIDDRPGDTDVRGEDVDARGARDAGDTEPEMDSTSPPDDTGTDVARDAADSRSGDTLETSDADATSLPGTYCRQLRALSGDNGLSALRREWTTGADAGPAQNHPGRTCGAHGDCTSQCGDAGQCIHRMFTTGDTWPANFENLKNADCACQLAAVRAGRSGTYRALLSNQVESARDRLALRARVYAMHYVSSKFGWTLIADDPSVQLWTNTKRLTNPPEYQEDGSPIQNPPDHAWTGWKKGGSSEHCSNWTSTSMGPSATAGRFGFESISWLNAVTRDCDQKLRLYCLEQ